MAPRRPAASASTQPRQVNPGLREPQSRSRSSTMDLPPAHPRSKPIPQLTEKKSGICAVLGVLRRVQTLDFHGFATNLAILATRHIRE